ncbi:AMP-binding protein, partial [Nostoc sp. NIES-2111]
CQLAAGLSAIGIVAGTPVGILMPNCPAYPEVYFAVLMAGGLVVNLNPLLAPEEIARQAEASHSQVVVTLDAPLLLQKLVPAMSNGCVARVIVAERRQLVSGLRAMLAWTQAAFEDRGWRSDHRFLPLRSLLREPQPKRIAGTPDDVAVVQFTGGTTGQPKAALLTHANLYANAVQLTRWLGERDYDGVRLLAVLPFFHAFGMTGVMNFAIALRASMLLVPRFDVTAILKAIDSGPPTIFVGVPAMYRALVEHPGFARTRGASLKLCVCGGDPLDPSVRQRFEARISAPLIEGYGLTECSPVVACGSLALPLKPGTAGLPLPGTSIAITDPADRSRMLAPGQTGEILVKGPQVMKGYLGASEDSAGLLPDGWLPTGDLGFLDTEGYLHLVGRLKDMLTVRGHHVYPEAIELVLRGYAGIADAAVLGIPDPRSGESTIRAIIVLGAGTKYDEGDLRHYLSQRLARHEMPDSIVIVAALPKSPLGKTQRSALHSILSSTGA